jgi:serine/threonine protein phosphatase PrpC
MRPWLTFWVEMPTVHGDRMGSISFACLSDRGRTHPGNEDRWFADPDVGLFLVADGMAFAEPAQLVVDHLPEMLRRTLTKDGALHEETVQHVRETLRELSRLVREVALSKPGGAEWLGLGATLVLLIVRPNQALIAHLGDSRIYRFRAGRLERLTRDHSMKEELIAAGRVDPADAHLIPKWAGPTRFVGMAEEAEADVHLIDAAPDDRLLLCSDGLPTMLADSEIAAILLAHSDPAQICRTLVDAANAAGGKDNITALLVAIAGSSS